jgi:uncharacterized protein involved in exopolysaccharide biosynthesis
MQEFSFGTLISRALQGWRTPVVFAGVLALLSLLTLIGSRPLYRVSMTIIPAPSDQGAGASVMPAGGTLTSLLGLQSGGDVNYVRYQKLLSSTVVAQRLEDKYSMLRFVFSSYWDPQRKIWVPHKTTRDYMVGWLLQLSNVPTWSPPDINALAAYLKSALIILPMQNSDIVTITMDHWDVAFAKRVMLTAHEQANEVLRDQIAKRARMQVAYLQGKLAQTSVQDYRDTLLTMLGTQEKMLMLTQTNASYAAEILSPPTASSTPVAPRPVLTMFVAVMVGILTGIAVVIFFGPDWWRQPLGRLQAIKASFRKKSLAAPH